MLLIKKKESTKNFFEVNKWSTKELEGYWIGGTVSGYYLFNLLSSLMSNEEGIFNIIHHFLLTLIGYNLYDLDSYLLTFIICQS